jgi:multidrug efflux system membrane fusion protein
MSFLRFLKSQWITILIVGALVAWMASGIVGGRQTPEVGGTDQPKAERPLTQVQVRDMAAEDVTRFVELQGQAEVERVATVRAETAGRVVELPGERGKRVETGAEIAVLSMNDRQARLEEAKALVEQRKSEFAAARQLGEKGFQAQNRVKEARAALAAAQARLAAIREEISDVRIVAPFSGVLETRPVEVGDYLSVGDEVATVVDDDPLKITAHVPQQKVNRIEEGASADIEFITGQTATGTVTLIASVAAESTRTYRIEVEVENAARAFRPGMSATLRIPTEVVQAQFVSPAIFSLDSEGRLGVKTVNADNQVVFHPVEPIQAAPDGVWVAGLPETARIITVGQGFVRAGETVKPVPEGASDNGAPATSEGVEPGEVAATGSAG